MRKWLWVITGSLLTLSSFAQLNGDLRDWFVDPGGTRFGWGSFANWVPGGGANPNNSAHAASGQYRDISWTIWDGYGPHGNATQGRHHDLRDFGGQQFDIKAIYVRNDPSWLFVGIVTGFNPNGTLDPYGRSVIYEPGDLAIDPDWAHRTSRLGVEVPLMPAGSAGQATLVQGGQWDVPHRRYGFPPPPYTNIASGATPISREVRFRYTDLGITYYDPVTRRDKPVYFLEFGIPLESLGRTTGEEVTLSWSFSCGNDYMSLTHQLVPEPSSWLSLFAGGGPTFLIWRRRRRANA